MTEPNRELFWSSGFLEIPGRALRSVPLRSPASFCSWLRRGTWRPHESPTRTQEPGELPEPGRSRSEAAFAGSYRAQRGGSSPDRVGLSFGPSAHPPYAPLCVQQSTASSFINFLSCFSFTSFVKHATDQRARGTHRKCTQQTASCSSDQGTWGACSPGAVEPRCLLFPRGWRK